MGPLDKANRTHWITYGSINIAKYTREIRVCQWEITGKCTIKIAEAYYCNSVLQFMASCHIFVTAFGHASCLLIFLVIKFCF